MALNPKLLAEAQDAAARLSDVQSVVEAAKAEYAGAVRRLHLAGGSLREIAAVLEISHQRVHQIIEASGVDAKWVKKPAADPLRCSFCGTAKCEKIVAGPGVYICGACIPAAAATARSTDAAAIATGTLALVSAEHGRLRCSFCGRARRQVGTIVAGPTDQICGKCVALCEEILAESRENA